MNKTLLESYKAIKTEFLSKELQLFHIKRYQEENNQVSIDLLLNSIAKLVVKIAYKYKNYGLDMMDLIQEGNMGVIKGAKRYKLDSKASFSTYASFWIIQKIQLFILRNHSLVRAETSIPKIKLFYILKETKNKIINEHPEMTNLEILEKTSKELNIPLKNVLEMDRKRKTSSMDAVIGDTDNVNLHSLISKDEKLIEDKLIENDVKDVVILISEHLDNSEREKNYFKMTKKEKLVIKELFFNNNDLKMADVARTLNISRERIRQIKNSALLKMRKVLKNNKELNIEALVRAM